MRRRVDHPIHWNGSPDTLERIKKRVTLSSLIESVMEAKRQGLVLRINLIIGFPGESKRDILRTMLFGLKMAIRGVDEVSTNIFSPYPGSELFRELHDEGRIHIDDDYFLALASLNSDFTKLNILTFNEQIGPRQLAVCRLALLLSCYFLSYVLYPWRIIRTLRNWWSGDTAATVFEHRFRDFIIRRLPFRGSTAGDAR